ncbi:ATP-binding protein [Streptomyces barkulensis]|uniref:ATP-binding protein n=1 Tax=Streptomyces barkulensis TaxID=1257026 RepID=UPI0023F6EFA3|nr:ATP-binding protein [Streptomyces barkulensis]
MAAATLVGEQAPAPDRRGEVFGDEVAAAAMIDRLVHHAEVVSLKEDGHRMRGRDARRVPITRSGE